MLLRGQLSTVLLSLRDTKVQCFSFLTNFLTIFNFFLSLFPQRRGSSSVGRALASQAGGREFETRLPLTQRRPTKPSDAFFYFDDMNHRIPEDTKRAILDAARIDEVVGDFVVLKKRGANYWGCCPFHQEKTPSFSVSPAKGIFKCFGCGKGGDSVSFLM